MGRFTGPWKGPVGPDVDKPVVGGRALALSGGGLRAALFELGVVERLYELGALDGVTYLTSVSGGSILAGLVALRWDELMAADDRRAAFDALVATPMCALARSDLRDRALRRAVVTVRSPIECVAEILDEELYDHATFARLPAVERLRVGFNACNLDDGKRFRFSQDSFGDAGGGYTTTACGDLPLATAVAASAAFPVGFAPLVVTLEGPYKTWDDAGAFVPLERQPSGPFPLGDGGIFENLALVSARQRCAEVIVVNGGEAVDTSIRFADGNLLTTAIRSIAILMGRNSRMAVADFLRDESYGLGGGVVIENTQVASNVGTQHLPLRTYDPLPKTPPPAPIDDAHFPPLPSANGYPRPIALALATLRTDLDAFSDLEIASLRYHGASLCDVGLRRFRKQWIDRRRESGRIGPPPEELGASALAELDRGKQHRFSDLFLRFWRT